MNFILILYSTIFDLDALIRDKNLFNCMQYTVPYCQYAIIRKTRKADRTKPITRKELKVEKYIEKSFERII